MLYWQPPIFDALGVRLSRLFSRLFIVLALTGCQSYSPPCGGFDATSWKRLDVPPIAAGELRKLALTSRISKGEVPAATVEKWFEIGANRVMLCRGVFEPADESYGEWWEFINENGQFQVTKQFAWVHID